jgi:hypothetical protein
MKPAAMIGIGLLILGVLVFAYQGINYTHREKLIDIGPIHATKETHERIPLPPIIGGVALVSGIILLAGGLLRKN